MENLPKSLTDVLSDVSLVIDEKELQQKVLNEAKKAATTAAARVLGQNPNSSFDIPEIDVDCDERDEYLLILEYLMSTGLKYTPAVLRFESQHPDVTFDRAELAKEHNLPTYDQSPLLVQLIEQRLRNIEQTKRGNI